MPLRSGPRPQRPARPARPAREVAAEPPTTHSHPFQVSFGLGPLPPWLAADPALAPHRGTMLGASGQTVWVAGPSTGSKRTMEAATGHPVELLLSTRSELELLDSGAIGFDAMAARASTGLVEELPGQPPVPGFVSGGPVAFEAWLDLLAVEWGISAHQSGEAFSLATGISFVRLDEFPPQAALLAVMGEANARSLRAVPLHHDGRTVHYATPGLPTPAQAHQVATLFGATRAQPLVCSLDDFRAVTFPQTERAESLEALIKAELGKRGLLSAARLRALERLAAEGQRDVRDCLVDLGILEEGHLTELTAEVLGIPAEPSPRPDPALCGYLSVPIMQGLDAVLLGETPLAIKVATSRRPSAAATELIQRIIGKEVAWFYTPPAALARALGGEVCGPPPASPSPVQLACQVLGVLEPARSAILASADPWRGLLPYSGTRPRLVSLAAWAYGIPSIRELRARLRLTPGGGMLLDYRDDSAVRPAVQPEEMAMVARTADPARPLRPVIVSHSHPNGGREAPHDLLTLVDRMEAARALPSGAGAAILLGVTQDDEATDRALVDDGVDPEAVARWLAAAIGTEVENLEPRFEERTVIDHLGRESLSTHSIEPVDAEIARLVPSEVALNLAAIPVRRDAAGKVVVAVADPFAGGLQGELRRHIDDPVRLVVATRPQIERALGRVGGRRLLGEMLLGWGISARELEAALHLQAREGIRLGQAVVALGYMTELDLADLVAEQLRIPLIDPEPESLDGGIVARLPELLCREYQLFPIAEDAGGLRVAMADPSDPDALAAIAHAYEGEVHRAVTTPRAVTRVLSHFYAELYRGIITDQLLAISPEDSARRIVTFNQKLVFAGLAVLIAAGLALSWLWTLIAINALATTFYLVSNVVKIWLMNRAIERSPELKIGEEEIADLDADQLPIYTILVPMYHEANVLPLLVDGMTRLDYPPSKLDVKLLLEPDDDEMLEAVSHLALPAYMEVLVVPEGQPKGKPKACNFGLLHARGEYVVIYDAEDRPESDQLKKSVLAFRRSPRSVVCVQAKLNYFNRRQNILTRWFTAEYSLWFDLFLPSLYDLDVPIPLGGTSNHFITDRLRAAGAWDPYNVTEDADLGLRIHKRGWTTAIVDSTTYEEANSNVYNWIRQRSRWVKGYIQTWLVHMRHPITLYRQLGWRGFAMFQIMIGGTVFSFLLNPVYWTLTTLWFLTHWVFVQSIFPPVLFYMGAAGLYLGNFAFTFANLGGCLRRGYYDEVKYALLVPAYWALMSVAAWKGFLQLFYKPFYWEKTIHGLHLAAHGNDSQEAG